MPGWPLGRLTIPRAQLVVVDVQANMLPHVAEHEQVMAQCVRMIRAAVALGLPITVSEQYVRGLGPTLPTVIEAANGATSFEQHEKMTFSVTGNETLRARIQGLNRPQVLLIGIESHVCVQQTALELRTLESQPIVLADAVGSRRPTDRAVALERIRSAGVIVSTVESVIFELLERAGTDLFKKLLPIVR